MKGLLKTLFCFCAVLMLISLSENALCEGFPESSNDQVALPEYTSATVNEEDYAHIFKDACGDMFYYNEKIPSGKYGYRLFLGLWDFGGVIYETSLAYDITNGNTLVNADFKPDQSLSFCYMLRTTSAPKHHVGVMLFHTFGDFRKTIRSTYIDWMKGGY